MTLRPIFPGEKAPTRTGPAGHNVQDEGVALPTQKALNFVGTGVTVTDVPDATTVTIPGNHTIQEEGTALAQRASLNFIGPRITATDDAGNNRTNVTVPDYLATWMGPWSSTAFTYRYGDIVERFTAFWLWNSGTPVLGGNGPGKENASWRMISGPAVMTTAEQTAWSPSLQGDTVWNADQNRLFINDDSQWRPVHPTTWIGTYTLNTYAPTTDGIYHQLVDLTLPYTGMATVVGRIDMDINTTGASEIRMITEIYRNAAKFTDPLAGSARTTVFATGTINFPISIQIPNLLANDRIVIWTIKVSGPATHACSVADPRFHGLTVTQPL